jgi:50S ribosomal subunit-associated GTPase HflX
VQDAGSADALFATLDTRVRRLALPGEECVPGDAPSARHPSATGAPRTGGRALGSDRSAAATARPDVLLVDTIGFIQGLPLDLVKAFQATLDEALDADLLVRAPRPTEALYLYLPR